MALKIKQSTWALVFAFSSLFTLGLADNVRGTLFPDIIAQFQISNTLGSWLFAAASSASFFAGLISPLYLMSFSISSLLFVGVLLLAVGSAVMGFSANFNWMISGSLFLGLGIGFLGVAQNLLVSENVDSQYRSRALSGLHGMYGLSSFFAPVLAASVAKFYGQWNSVFYVISIICILFLIIQSSITANPSFSVQRKVITESAVNKERTSKRALLMVAGFFSFYVVAEILVSSRLAQYMRTYHSMDLSQSANYVTLFFLFLLSGRMLFTFVRLKYSLKSQLIGFLTAALVMVLLGLFSHPFFLALSGLAMAPYYPLCVSYISEISKDLARIFISFSLSFQSLAVVVMHLGVGYMTDVFGLAFAFGVGIVSLIVAILCLNYHPQKLTV